MDDLFRHCTTDELVQRALENRPVALEAADAVVALWAGHIERVLRGRCPLCGHADARCQCWEDDA